MKLTACMASICTTGRSDRLGLRAVIEVTWQVVRGRARIRTLSFSLEDMSALLRKKSCSWLNCRPLKPKADQHCGFNSKHR